MEKKKKRNRRILHRLQILGELVITVDGQKRTYNVTEDGCVITEVIQHTLKTVV